MKIETIVTYTKEDEELLRKPLPQDPCEKCYNKIGCCGCDKGKAYGKAVKPYRDAGVYEIAEKLRTMREIEADARALIERYEQINKTLPHFIKQANLSIKRTCRDD